MRHENIQAGFEYLTGEFHHWMNLKTDDILMKTKMNNWIGGTLFKTAETLTCKEGSKNFQLLIDGEASEEQKLRLMNHLNECNSCNSTFTLDKTLKDIIKARVQDKPCPEHLVEIIRAKLAHND